MRKMRVVVTGVLCFVVQGASAQSFEQQLLQIRQEVSGAALQTRQALPPANRVQDLAGLLRDATVFLGSCLDSLKLNPFGRRISEDAKHRIQALQPSMPRGRKIPADFFERFAELKTYRMDQSEDVGLIENFESLRSDDFDVSKVDPRVRDFYENTGRYKIFVRADKSKMNPVNEIFLRAFVKLMESEGNLTLPLNGHWLELESNLATMNLASEIPGGFQQMKGTVWTRSNSENHRVILNGLYMTMEFKNRTYVTVVFPYHAGNGVTVMRPSNIVGGGMRLSAKIKNDPIAGDYVSLTRGDGSVKTVWKSHRLTQELDAFVDPADGQLKVNHYFYGSPNSTLILEYKIQ